MFWWHGDRVIYGCKAVRVTLSPFLFRIFSNDMETVLIQSGIVWVYLLMSLKCLYVDDAILMAESEHSLQWALDSLTKYCDKWKLAANKVKTKIMFLKKGDQLRKIKFHYWW